MQAIVKMTRGGQIVVPIELREAMGLGQGDLLEIDVMRKIKPENQEHP